MVIPAEAHTADQQVQPAAAGHDEGVWSRTNQRAGRDQGRPRGHPLPAPTWQQPAGHGRHPPL